jgi:uncharacterized membrane protein
VVAKLSELGLSPELWAQIITIVIGVMGGWIGKLKLKTKEIEQFIVQLNDAIYDDKVTAEELKKLSDTARKIAKA